MYFTCLSMTSVNSLGISAFIELPPLPGPETRAIVDCFVFVLARQRDRLHAVRRADRCVVVFARAGREYVSRRQYKLVGGPADLMFRRRSGTKRCCFRRCEEFDTRRTFRLANGPPPTVGSPAGLHVKCFSKKGKLKFLRGSSR